jgi:ABC-type cobalamin/Fe3+-siderophores transport system ATPase subunit
MQSLKFGIIIKDILKNKLKSCFPKERFVIILTCDGKDKLNTIIRFHKFRKGEILYDQKIIDLYDRKSRKVIPCGFLVEEI